jgi:hypothetical protein
VGDRCRVELHCYKKNLGRFENLGFTEQGDLDLPDGVCRVVDEQANGAHYTELSQLKSVFFGQHGEGDQYDGRRFVSDGRKYLDVVVGVEHDIVVPVDGKGDPIKGEVLNVKRYLEMRAKVTAEMGLVCDGGIWTAKK